MLRSYQDLKAWQRAMLLVTEVYSVTEALPPRERNGLTAPLRRAAVSVPSNIAEGYGRRHRREYIQFVSIALGSLCETESQLLIVANVGLRSSGEVRAALALCVQVRRLLTRLRDSLSRDPSAPLTLDP
jgi:four helix bundle protein